MSRFFTVVIPTRNRPDLITDCVESVLAQDFQDFEILISDNSSNDYTRQMLGRFNQDSRIELIQPPNELSMPDHWEFASQRPRGEYVLYLTDRSILKKTALKKAFQALNVANQVRQTEVMSWAWDLYDDQYNLLMPIGAQMSAAAERLSTQTVLKEFLNRQGFFSFKFPRALNGCYLREYGESVRRRFGRLFRPLAPDNSFAFMSLLDLNEILHLPEALFLSRGLKMSNGDQHYFGDAIAYCRSLGEEARFLYSPMPSQTVENGHYEDYFRCLVAHGRPVELEPQEWVVFYIKCFWENYAKKSTSRLDLKPLVQQFEQEWSKALSHESSAVQAAVLKQVEKAWKQKARFHLQAWAWPRELRQLFRFAQAKTRGRIHKSALDVALLSK